jgi:hypothetical protein
MSLKKRIYHLLVLTVFPYGLQAKAKLPKALCVEIGPASRRVVAAITNAKLMGVSITVEVSGASIM